MAQSPSIKITNLNRAYDLDIKFIKGVVLEVLEILKKGRGAWLEIIFLDDKHIRILNRRYKKIDRPTDVLSFYLGTGELGRNSFLGELFISSDRALGNSKIFKTKFEEELVLYVIHGILHLFGYDDQTKKGRLRMSKKEESVLSYLCKRKNLSKVLTPR